MKNQIQKILASALICLVVCLLSLVTNPSFFSFRAPNIAISQVTSAPADSAKVPPTAKQVKNPVVKLDNKVPAIVASQFEISSDIDRIIKRGEIIIATLGVDNPPFFEKVNGEDVGLDIEIGKSIAEELGVKAKFDRSPKTFNETVEMVQAKKADLAISKLSISMKRAKQVMFSEPYVTMRQALLINRLQLAKLTSAKLNVEEAIKQLSGKVGVIQNSQYAIFARKRFPKATVVEFPSWKEVVNAVSSGEVLAAFRDELEIKKVVLQQPDFALQVQTVAFSDTTDFLAIVVHWQNRNLVDFINHDLRLNKLSYDAQQVITKYRDIFTKEPI
jgi:polar amino acid transport system substrate-binding protein